MIVRVGGALTENYRRGNQRVAIRYLDRSADIIKEAGVAKIVGRLSSHFSAQHQIMFYFPGRNCIAEICLIKEVSTLGGIVISRHRHQRHGGVNGAWHIVLITAVVISKH